mmetsp:Transcript_8537/g.24312  ORF Transcript_8537/g.24312 Transcript_8537/m.24312 type:complete len:255 (+) Transcript_8537:140-904(+)
MQVAAIGRRNPEPLSRGTFWMQIGGWRYANPRMGCREQLVTNFKKSPCWAGVKLLRTRQNAWMKGCDSWKPPAYWVYVRRLATSMFLWVPPMTICSSLASNIRIQSTGMISWNPRRKARHCGAISLFRWKSARRYWYSKKLELSTTTSLPPGTRSRFCALPYMLLDTLKVRVRSSRLPPDLAMSFKEMRLRYISGSSVYRSSIWFARFKSLLRKNSVNWGFTRIWEYTAFPSTRPMNAKCRSESGCTMGAAGFG